MAFAIDKLKNVRILTAVAVVGLQLLVCIGCAPGSSSSMSPIPAANTQFTITKSVSHADDASAHRPFRDDAKAVEVSFQINDRNFANRLNTGGREPVVVQDGTVLPAGEKPKASGIYCGFRMKDGGNKGPAGDQVAYTVDRDSLKKPEAAKTKSLQFSLNDLISVECTDPRTGRSDELSTAEVRDAVGQLLSVSRLNVERIIPGPIGSKLDLLVSKNQSPTFGVIFDLKEPASLKLNFQAIAFRLVGDKPGQIAPSHLAFVNKNTHELLTPWTPTGHTEAVMLPDSIVTFQLELNEINQIKKVLNSLRDMAVAISVQSPGAPSPVYHVDLLEICEKYPDKIVDLATGSTGCPGSLSIK